MEQYERESVETEKETDEALRLHLVLNYIKLYYNALYYREAKEW